MGAADYKKYHSSKAEIQKRSNVGGGTCAVLYNLIA